MLVPPESSSAVLVIISSKCVSICNTTVLTLVNSGKITIFGGGISLSCTRSRRISSPSGTKFGHSKLETTLSQVETPGVSISLGIPGRADRQTNGRMDRQTDRIAITSTRLALRAVARKNVDVRIRTVDHTIFLLLNRHKFTANLIVMTENAHLSYVSTIAVDTVYRQFP